MERIFYQIQTYPTTFDRLGSRWMLLWDNPRAAL